MAAGDFLSGLARGIFGEQEKMRQEQMERDSAAQKNTINVLADLYQRVRPESQSVILDQLGKAIGVKGKMQKFWQALSGVPNRSIEDQLGTQLRDLAGMSISPKTAAGIESKADVARLFGAESPLSQMFQGPQARARQSALDAEKGLAGKLIFKDPIADQERLITTRYEAQTQAALEKSAADRALAQRYALERDDANRKGRINQAFYNRILNAQSKQIGKAYELWWDDYNAGRTQAEPGVDPAAIPPTEYMARAGQLLQGRFNLQGKNIESQMDFREKQGNPGQKPLTPAQQAQLDQELTNEIQKRVGATGQAKKKRDVAAGRRDALRKTLEDYARAKGLTFDPNTGMFMGSDDMKSAQAALMLEIQSPKGVNPVEDYLKAKAEAEGAQFDLDTEFGMLKDKRYQKRVTIGQTPDEPITIIPQRGQKPAPAVKGRVGMTTDRLLNRGEQILRIPPETVEVGQEIPFKDGRTYKVIRKGKDHIIVRFIN